MHHLAGDGGAGVKLMILSVVFRVIPWQMFQDVFFDEAMLNWNKVYLVPRCKLRHKIRLPPPGNNNSILGLVIKRTRYRVEPFLLCLRLIL